MWLLSLLLKSLCAIGNRFFRWVKQWSDHRPFRTLHANQEFAEALNRSAFLFTVMHCITMRSECVIFFLWCVASIQSIWFPVHRTPIIAASPSLAFCYFIFVFLFLFVLYCPMVGTKIWNCFATLLIFSNLKLPPFYKWIKLISLNND